MKPLQLSDQFKIAFIIALLLPFALAMTSAFIYFSDTIYEEAQKKILLDAKVASLIYQNELHTLEDFVRNLTQKRSFRNYANLGLYFRIDQQLKKMIPIDSTYGIILHPVRFADQKIKQDRFYSSALEGKSISSTESLAQAEIKQKNLISNHSSEFIEQNQSLFLSLKASSPLYSPDGKSTLGVFVVRKFLNQDQTLIAMIEKELNVKISIFDKNGKMITTSLDPEQSFVANVSLSSIIHQEIQRTKSSYQEVLLKKEGYLAFYKPIFNLEGEWVGIMQVKDSVEKYVDDLHFAMLNLFMIGAFGCLFALSIGVYISRRITTRLKVLSNGAETIANGDYSFEMNVEYQDEIGELAQRFTQMSRNLREVSEGLQHSQRKLQLLLECSRDLALALDKFHALRLVTNAVLQKIYVQKLFPQREMKTLYPVDLFFQQSNGNEQPNYAIFRLMQEVLSEDSEGQLKQPKYIEPDIAKQPPEWIHQSYSMLTKNPCFFLENSLYMIGLHGSEVHWGIRIGGIDEGFFLKEDQEFFETLSQFLGTSLENIDDNLSLEQKVTQRTQELEKTLFELAQRHRQLQQAQTQLVQSEKMAALGTLVSGVAHEINNPTNFVYTITHNLKNNLETLNQFIFDLAGEEADAEFVEAFEAHFHGLYQNLSDIREGSNRIKTIVHDLRMFSRLEEAERKRVDIVESLESTLRLIQTTYKNQVEFVRDYQVKPEIDCWPAQMNQVFMNVMVNACQAIQAKLERTNAIIEENQMSNIGILKIQTFFASGTKHFQNPEETDQHTDLVIRFVDSGCGMSPSVKNKIFEPFFTTKPTGTGNGMGMSISYGIMKKHQGRIEVESEMGVGTNLSLILPLFTSN